jgi:hypothetical protein
MRVAEAGAERGVRSRTGVIVFVSVLTVGGVLDDDLVLLQQLRPQQGRSHLGRGQCQSGLNGLGQGSAPCL